MLDAKFVCTISALVAALVAVCSFNSNQKMEIIEGYGNSDNTGRGFGAWQGASQFSVYKDPAQVAIKVDGKQVVTPEDIKQGMFYSTVGLQQQLAPRASASSIYGALKNQSQAQTQQAANGPHGAIPPYQGAVMTPEETVTNAAFSNTGLSSVSSIGVPTIVQDSSALTSGESQAVTKAASLGGSNIMYSMSQASENYQPNIENFIVPGDKKPRCSTQNCPTGNGFMADPVMHANYTNGNFATVHESMLEPIGIQDIPIGTLRTLNAAGNDTDILQLNRLVYANTKSRSRGESCPFRGDIIPKTVLARDQGRMFCPAQAFRGVEPLGLGALGVMGGPNGPQSTLGDQITAAVAGRATTVASGQPYTHGYINELLGAESTLAIEAGLNPEASLDKQAAAATALAVGASTYTVNTGVA